MNAEFHQLRVLFCFSKIFEFSNSVILVIHFSKIARFSMFFDKMKK